MSINDEQLEKFITNINNDTLTIENIDDFGNKVSVEGLNEFFQLIEDEKADLFSLKVYTTVYDKEKIKEVENLRSENYINSIFAAMWEKEASQSSSKELSEAMLGFVIFGSDLISRVRKGYELLNYSKKDLNKQIYNFISFLSESIEENRFFRDISQVQTQASDDFLFKSNSEEFTSIKKLKERIEIASLILKETPDISSIFERKYENVKKSDLTFIDDEHLSILNKDSFKLKSKIKIEKEIEDNENCNPFKTEDLSGFEILQDVEEDLGLKDLFKSIFKSKKKRNSSSIKLNNLRSEQNRKGSSFKVTVVLFLFIAVAGIGIIAATQKSKVVENENIAEKIAEENINNQNFIIKRSGTNKD